MVLLFSEKKTRRCVKQDFKNYKIQINETVQFITTSFHISMEEKYHIWYSFKARVVITSLIISADEKGEIKQEVTVHLGMGYNPRYKVKNRVLGFTGSASIIFVENPGYFLMRSITFHHRKNVPLFAIVTFWRNRIITPPPHTHTHGDRSIWYKFGSPSLAMVTYPYKWNILEHDVKQMNKQTNKRACATVTCTLLISGHVSKYINYIILLASISKLCITTE